MSTKRYAVYYVPPRNSALALFGQEWLGIDIETGSKTKQLEVPSLSQTRFSYLTSTPRLYGFHGTLKPPFTLNEHTTLQGLLTATHLLAKSMSPIQIPPLELAFIGKFLALSPEAPSIQLEVLAGKCVRALEGFRRRRSEQEAAMDREAKLTVHQEQMLDNWGYPYVLEEFRFHMTLTEKIESSIDREFLLKAANEKCQSILGEPIEVTEITVCCQDSNDQPMYVIERIPLGIGQA